jgi:ketosteroid isomerase-like protein
VRSRRAGLGVLAVLLAAGCTRPPGADQQAAEAARLLAAYQAFAAASVAKGAGPAFYEVMTEDGLELPANDAPLQGRAKVRDHLGDLGGKVLTWAPQKAEVARSLDLGWTWGEWQMWDSSASKKVLAHGKYMDVWKRGADGAWKLAVDMGNQAEQAPDGGQ